MSIKIGSQNIFWKAQTKTSLGRKLNTKRKLGQRRALLLFVHFGPLMRNFLYPIFEAQAKGKPLAQTMACLQFKRMQIVKGSLLKISTR
jgi:hypothetical protein